MQLVKSRKSASIFMCEWFDEHVYKVLQGKKPPIYITSVTTKLDVAPKPFLAIWRGNIGNREADLRVREAQEHGSIVHYACAMAASGGASVYNPPYFKKQNYTEKEIAKLQRKYKGHLAVLKTQEQAVQVGRFGEIVRIMKPRIQWVEEAVFSEKYDAAGTVDQLWFIKAGTYKISGKSDLVIETTGFYVIDLKTGAVGYDNKLQAATYVKIAREMYPKLGVVGAIILYLDADIKTGLAGTKALQLLPAEIETRFKEYQHLARVWDDRNPKFSPTIFEFPSLVTFTPTRKKKKGKKAA